jgi:hypothetical protein
MNAKEEHDETKELIQLLNAPGSQLFPWAPTEMQHTKERRFFAPNRYEGEEEERWPFAAAIDGWQTSIELVDLGRLVQMNLENRLRIVQAEIAELRKSVELLGMALSERPVTSSSWIIDLDSEDYSLRYPIPIVMEDWQDEVVASFVETELFGSGTTPSEALTELKRRIVALYEELAGADPETFGRLPRTWWRVLQYYMVRHEYQAIQEARSSSGH